MIKRIVLALITALYIILAFIICTIGYVLTPFMALFVLLKWIVLGRGKLEDTLLLYDKAFYYVEYMEDILNK